MDLRRIYETHELRRLGKYLALGFAVLVIHVAVLYVMGRIPWCASGFGIWTSDAWSDRTSQDFADPYSFSHVLHGVIFYWALQHLAKNRSMPQRFILAMLIEVAWEILENSPIIISRYRNATAALGYSGDSILNSVGDIFSCLIGFWMAMRWPVKVVVALVIFEELALLIAIRDNLTLNVIMLIHPIQAIKDWQLGG